MPTRIVVQSFADAAHDMANDVAINTQEAISFTLGFITALQAGLHQEKEKGTSSSHWRASASASHRLALHQLVNSSTGELAAHDIAIGRQRGGEFVDRHRFDRRANAVIADLPMRPLLHFGKQLADRRAAPAPLAWPHSAAGKRLHLIRTGAIEPRDTANFARADF